MIPVYQIGVASELLAISLVKNPAIEEPFQYFSEEQQVIKFSSDEKHQVIGPLIVADKPIYRRYKDQEFYVAFSKEAIEAMLYDFAKNGRNQSITLSHQEDVNGAVVTEIWTSGKNDKSHDYGYDLPEGSLFCSMKVNNADLWQKIKSGEVKGFSIESLLEVIDYNNFNKMKENKMKDDKNETFFEKLKNLINDTFNTTTSKEPETTEEPQKTENSTASKENFENEATEVVEPTAKTEAVETPAQTETVEPHAKPETVEVQTTAETPVEEHQQTETVETTAKTVEAPNYEELYNSLKEENASTSKALEEIKKQVESLKAENETLKGRPSAEPVKPTASGSRSFGETHDILRKLYERSPIQ